MDLFDGQPQGVSIRECARQLGVSDTAIRKAIATGRCAKLSDGLVNVEAVRAGMNLTANPFRGGQRQAGVFGVTPVQAVVSGSTFPPLEPAFTAAHPDPKTASASPAAANQAALLVARLSSEESRAEREKIELAMLKETVALVDPMVRAIVDAMTETRSALLALPDRLTPLVTPETDAGKIYAAIEAEVQRMCQGLQEKLDAMAKGPR